MKKYGPRQNPWLYEMDGALNPTWILVVITFLLGVGASIAAIIIAVVTKDATALKFAFGFIALTLIALLGSALPRDRAKILLQSKVLSQGLGGITQSVGQWGINTEPYDDAIHDTDTTP